MPCSPTRLASQGISGIPAQRRGLAGKAGRHTDVRVVYRPRQPVAERITKDRLVTVRESVGQEQAKRSPISTGSRPDCRSTRKYRCA
jgi:hypothetical protein